MERVGRVMGNQLRCLGLTMNFAPVVDVDTTYLDAGGGSGATGPSGASGRSDWSLLTSSG